jgi:hypothetical protein
MSRIYDLKFQPVSAKAIFLLVHLCIDTYEASGRIISQYSFEGFVEDFGYESADWKVAVEELKSTGLLVIDGDSYVVGENGELFSFKAPPIIPIASKARLPKRVEKSEDFHLPELLECASKYSAILPKLSSEITERVDKIVAFANLTVPKPQMSGEVFTAIYELVYQEIGRSRPVMKKEFFVHKSLCNTYDSASLVKMYFLFLSNIDKFFKSGSPNIGTFNFVKDRLYIEIKGKTAQKNVKPSNSFTYE